MVVDDKAHVDGYSAIQMPFTRRLPRHIVTFHVRLSIRGDRMPRS
jgi:hypothetical protein